jgi:hypothetical protein
MTDSAALQDLRDRYLTLLARSLTDTAHSHTTTCSGPNAGTLQELVPEHPRWTGDDWPLVAETMVGMRRLENLRSLLESILADNVPGDFIECGVWRGGASIFAAGVLQAHGSDRGVWAADSFAGLPPPDVEKYPLDKDIVLHRIPYLAVSLEIVQQNFSRYGVLNDKVQFVRGLFRDSLPALRDRQWCLIRADCDMYESTHDVLLNLYAGLAPGGYIIADEYYHMIECRTAVEDFRREHGITEPIIRIDRQAAYWRKSG